MSKLHIEIEEINNGYVMSSYHRDGWTYVDKPIKTSFPTMKDVVKHIDGVWGEVERVVKEIREKDKK